MTILDFGWPEVDTNGARDDSVGSPLGVERWTIPAGLATIFVMALLCAVTTHPLAADSLIDPATSAIELFVDVGDPDCDDTNPGTEEDSLCTIQEAADRAQPGIIVFVKAGTYRETVTVATSGAPGALIKFVNYGEDHVIIDSPGDACFDLRGVSYIKIHGFEMTGAWPATAGSARAHHIGEITPAHGGGIRGFPLTQDGYGVQNSVCAHNVMHDNDSGIWPILVLTDLEA